MNERALTDIEAQRIRLFRDEYIRLAIEYGVLFTSCNCCSGIGLVIRAEPGVDHADQHGFDWTKMRPADLFWSEGLGSGDDLLDSDTWEKVIAHGQRQPD